MSTNIVPLGRRADGTLVVSSETIAAGAEVEHRAVLQLLTNYAADFAEFGEVAFEMRAGYNNARVRIALLNEQQATLLMTYQKNTERVREFKKALVKAFYTAAQTPREVSRRELAQMIIDAEDRAELETKRADKAEHTVKAIESADGITLRELHKHYVSEIAERKFFTFLYDQGILINQLNTRIDPETGKKKNGRQHQHPSFKGKAWLYLHGTLVDGVRRERTRVRPGAPELAFAQFLASKGMPINSTAARHFKEIAA